jgi:Uma2 family endonuclease
MANQSATTTSSRKQWTDEKLMALPKDGYKRELLDGEIVMSPAGSEHGRKIMRFSASLLPWVYEHNLGELFDGQTGFRMKSGDLLSPDVSFVSRERLFGLRQAPEGFFEGAPDLAIEFLSRGETKKTVERKIALYFDNGTRLAWLVELRRRLVSVYRSATDVQKLTKEQFLDGEAVVPGFRIAVENLFAGFDYGGR